MLKEQVTKPLIVIDVDGLDIPRNQLTSVSLYSSIDQTLPELTFKILDTGGSQISCLYLYVGAKVGVTLWEIEQDKHLKDEESKRPYMDFVITRIFDGFEHNDAQTSGYIQIWCKPAWYLFGSYQGHAYAPMKLSELIKEVCKSANESCGFIVEDKNFGTSSDPGNIPRYKTGESDLDFIENKLLPYTNIDDSNVFFYIDYFGYPRLTSFQRLIQQSPTLLVSPPSGVNDTVQNKVKDLVEQLGTESNYMWDKIELNLGDSDLRKAFAALKMKVTFENNETGKVYIANQQPRIRLGENSGDNYNSKTPLNAIRMEYIEASSNKAYPNRILSDALAMARNEDTNMVDFIDVTITVNAVANLIKPGDVMYLLMPIKQVSSMDEDATDEEKKKVIHWMNGKWLIKSVQINQEDSEPGKVSTLIEIVRPTIQFNKKTTTLAAPNHFYTVA